MNERVPMIRKKLKKKLEPYRYEHTLSVSYTAMALAMRYGCDLEKGIPVTEDEEKNKVLLHAKYGSYMAEHKYQITDPEILSAIRYHTTGKPDMTLLEKIIYIADYIEPRRNKADNLDSMRQLAFVDIDQALTEIMQGILVYLNETGSNVDSQTESAIDYYQNRQAI